MLETSNPQQRHSLQRSGGFTLIEIMAVVLIIGLLSAMVGVNIFSQVTKGKRTAAQAQISNLESVLELYRMDNGRYPTTEDGLQALIVATGNVRNFPRGSYLKGAKLPKDPWGGDYSYEQPGRNNTYAFDLCSLGPDSNAGGEDNDADICN
jgi:general secretion pathway protein G